jgi:uncharacterized repeat protein (TIGR03803 family)
MPRIASHVTRAAAALWLAALSVSPAAAAITPWRTALADRAAAPSGTEHIVHAFDAATRDGSHSTALPLLLGSSAFLTTQNGGLNSDFGVGGYGTVVELSRTGFAWPERVIYDFKSGDDGANPAGGVIADRAGNLYGTASLGGLGFPNGGTVFELSRDGSGWKETTLHEFGLTAGDGAYPQGALLEDAAGDFFGTTPYGGGGSLCNYGCGTLFELEPVDGGRTYREVILHRFTGGNDGAYPVAALIADSTGALYGTASSGGPYGQGVIFKVLPPADKRPWEFYAIRYLTGGSDGGTPTCTLARASNGVLFGTTSSGGHGAEGGSGGYGVVFSLTPEASSPVRYEYRVLHAFTAGNDGLDPLAGVTIGKGGILYGTTGSNPGGNLGTVYELVPPAYQHYVLYTSTVGVDGLSGLDGGVAIDQAGNLIGAAVHGPGIGQAGFVFDVVPKQ